MHNGAGQIAEIYLDGSARLDCPPNLVPIPGQYLLAHAPASGSPTADALFFYDSAPTGFRFAPPLPPLWTVGTHLNLRGPLGRGFNLPAAAHRLALLALDDAPVRLHGLMSHALQQGAEIVLLTDRSLHDLPEEVEVQPLQAVPDVCKWADVLAVDVLRENLDQLKKLLGGAEQEAAAREAQVLVRAPMPCGGVAECGVCAVHTHPDWMMICKDGPVLMYRDLLK